MAPCRRGPAIEAPPDNERLLRNWRMSVSTISPAPGSLPAVLLSLEDALRVICIRVQARRMGLHFQRHQRRMKGRDEMRRSNHAKMRGRLMTLVGTLSSDELSVLVLLAERLAAGQHTYGVLRVHEDGRNFPREALEESVDLAAYVAMALLRLGADRRG